MSKVTINENILFNPKFLCNDSVNFKHREYVLQNDEESWSDMTGDDSESDIKFDTEQDDQRIAYRDPSLNVDESNCIRPSFIKNTKQTFSELPLFKIGISYRGIEDLKDAKGIFFDHFVIQKIQKDNRTVILLPQGMEKDQIYTMMKSYVKQLPYGLYSGVMTDFCDKVLPDIGDENECGLLIIPGRTRGRENNIERRNHEEQLLRKALLRGQPVLGICAGAWRLWEALWIRDLYPTYLDIIEEQGKKEKEMRGFLKSVLCEVKDHSYHKMMSLSQTKARVTYNKMIHGLKFKKKTLLYQMMCGKDGTIPEDYQVNSVHHKAPTKRNNAKIKEEKRPFGINVAALSIDLNLKVISRRPGYLEPEENVIEGFSSEYGAPIVGVCWHPEASAHSDDYSKRLIMSMIKAGMAYTFKRQVLQQLLKIVKGPIEINNNYNDIDLASSHKIDVYDNEGQTEDIFIPNESETNSKTKYTLDSQNSRETPSDRNKLQELVRCLRKDYTMKEIVEMAGYSKFNIKRDFNNMLTGNIRNPGSRYDSILKALEERRLKKT